MEPQIRYVRTADNVPIAFTVIGEGPPLLFARPFINPGLDNELTWRTSAEDRGAPHAAGDVDREDDVEELRARRGTLAGSAGLWPKLTKFRSVVLWDLRGVGLSGSAPEAGFDDWLADVEAVADAAHAATFDLAAVGGLCHLAISYAARRPDRVNRLLLDSPSPPGFSLRRNQTWLFDLASDHWFDFVNMLALRLFGWDRADIGQRWADRIREHFNAEQYLRYMDAIEAIDSTGDCGAIRAPTLVVDDRDAYGMGHGRGLSSRQLVQFARELAGAIPQAELAIIIEPDRSLEQVAERFLQSRGGGIQPTIGERETGTAVILFADIADSTALTERMGDGAFRQHARALDDALREAIRDAGGTAIDGKLLGDGVLATFPSASQAIDAAIKCCAAGDERSLRLHVGLHAGDVIREQGNVFGGAVNIASRISGLSAPGEVLVSDIVRGLARTSAGVTFEDRGEHVLKGVADPQRVYAVRRRD